MTFVDPRTKPSPPFEGVPRAPAATQTEVKPLIDAISDGRIYTAEAWIAEGRPLQFVYAANGRGSPSSPLQAAICSGLFDAVLLLLCNGYRLDLERASPLDEAFNARRLDIVRLLLAWGADPLEADPNRVVSCYDAALVEEFWRRGIDFAYDNALAGALAYATSNKPLYGFVKRHAPGDPRLQRELDRGLSFAVERNADENDDSVQKAVHLCIWAGADPWRRVEIPFEDDGDDQEENEWYAAYCAAGRVAYRGRADLVRPLKLRAGAAHFQDLYDLVRDAKTYDVLAQIAPPRSMSRLIAGVLSGLAIDRSLDRHGGTWFLRHLFEIGGRLDDMDESEIAQLRVYFRKAGDFETGLLVRMLREPEHVEPSVFVRIIATPTLIRRRLDFGILRSSLYELVRRPDIPEGARAAARRELRVASRRYRRH